MIYNLLIHFHYSPYYDGCRFAEASIFYTDLLRERRRIYIITRQKELFIDEYVKRRCKNMKEAAIAAGYSPRSAHVQASMLLKEPEMAALLKFKLDEMKKEMRKEFMFDAIEARKAMYKILQDPYAKDSDKISVAKDFLDRAGFKSIDQHDITMDAVVVFEGMENVPD